MTPEERKELATRITRGLGVVFGVCLAIPGMAVIRQCLNAAVWDDAWAMAMVCGVFTAASGVTLTKFVLFSWARGGNDGDDHNL